MCAIFFLKVGCLLIVAVTVPQKVWLWWLWKIDVLNSLEKVNEERQVARGVSCRRLLLVSLMMKCLCQVFPMSALWSTTQVLKLQRNTDPHFTTTSTDVIATEKPQSVTESVHAYNDVVQFSSVCQQGYLS